MTWDRALESLMTQTCWIAPPGTTRSFYGTLAASTTATAYRCRWVQERDMIRGTDGEERVQRGVLWVASTERVSPESVVTLPDGTTAPLLAVEEYPDMDGVHHIKLRLGFDRSNAG